MKDHEIKKYYVIAASIHMMQVHSQFFPGRFEVCKLIYLSANFLVVQMSALCCPIGGARDRFKQPQLELESC